jgi:hypothetical protein
MMLKLQRFELNLHGSCPFNCWINTGDISVFLSPERRILKFDDYKVIPKYENGEWKSRTNRELEEMNKGENIVKRIKGQRISCLGHLERMEEDRMPKKMFPQELEGKRRRRRPRKGWKEKVEKDLQVLGVRRWRELVTDRKKWKGIVRQAKAHSGV